MHPLHRITIKNSFRDVQQTIANGIVETTAKERCHFWAAWTHWLACVFPTIDLYCLHQPTKVQIELLTAFATHVRHGRFLAQKYQVCTKTVQVALRAVTKKFELDGQQNPLVNSQGVYTQKIKQLLNGFRKFDPPPKRKLAIPLAVPAWLLQQGLNSTDSQYKAIGDLTIIAFYFLLQPGEYTYSPPKDRKQTIPFRHCDVYLWEHNKILDPNLPLKDLYKRCTGATLQIANQKTGRKAERISHSAIPATHKAHVTCPIRTLIWRLKHIQTHSTDTTLQLGTYFTQTGKKHTLRPRSIMNALRVAVKALQLHKVNITASQVSSHSLRAGGATAMHINGVPEVTIQKMGRWSSNTFLIYIRDQLFHFSANIATAMSTEFPLFTVHIPIHPLTY